MSGTGVFFSLVLLCVIVWGIRSYIRKRKSGPAPGGGSGGGGNGDGTPKQQQ